MFIYIYICVCVCVCVYNICFKCLYICINYMISKCIV